MRRAPFRARTPGEVLARVCGYSPERVADLLANEVAVGHVPSAHSSDGAVVPSAAADVAAVQAQGPPRNHS